MLKKKHICLFFFSNKSEVAYIWNLILWLYALLAYEYKPQGTEKIFYCSIDTWFCKIKFNFVGLKQ